MKIDFQKYYPKHKGHYTWFSDNKMYLTLKSDVNLGSYAYLIHATLDGELPTVLSNDSDFSLCSDQVYFESEEECLTYCLMYYPPNP